MKRTLHARKARPGWLVFLSQYRYQVLILVIIVVLLVVIGGSHNPSDLEGVYVG
jgi:hypothetical protein